MTLAEQIESDYLEAYKSKDEDKTSLLRLLKSSIKNAEIAQKGNIGDQDAIKLIQKEVKQRRDAIKEYKRGEREDLAEKESQEIEMLKIYLPKELSDQELEVIVKNGIAQINASSPSDFGKAMGVIMPKIAGRAGGDRVSQMLKQMLQ